jgi:hypothetical protein
MEVPVALWLRITVYGIAAAMGVGGAMLGYSKPVTMLAILAVALGIEGINYAVKKRTPDA